MDNAFEKARAAYGTGAYDDATLEFLFPELKESEDERIRKQVEQVLIEHDWSVTYGVSKDKCLAWLEKQKEQKPEYCHHEVDLSDCSEEYRKAYYDGWNNCNQQHSQCEAKQKPAKWSEEDEKEMKKLISWLRGCIYHSTTPQEVAYKRHVATWLKSLRPSWKPSEEQMKALNKVAQEGALLDLFNDLLKLM